MTRHCPARDSISDASILEASIWIGGCLAGLCYGKFTDIIGRRPALLWAAILTVIGVIIQTAARNIAMFVVARIIIGFGTSASGLTGPVYLAETLPYQWRAWGLGVFNDFYYVGGLIAAGITFGTAPMGNPPQNSTWAWRIPSLIQGVFSLICIIIIPFLPESPRWLTYQNRPDEALTVVAHMYTDGETDHPLVATQYKEIVDTITFEKEVAEPLSLKQLIKTSTARKRVLLACSAAVFSTLAGNIVASYYLGILLDNAGVTDPTTQLQINIILNAWCLVCSIFGTWGVDKLGRKPLALFSQGALTIFLFIVGALTKTFGSSSNTSGVYATVAAIFLFQGSYSVGWTPLLYLYPPEVMNYSIRANGMGVFQFALNATALWAVFAFPFALTGIGWKIYMINGAWDVVFFVIIAVWWVETSGKTLEEEDQVLEGVKHSEVPDLEVIMRGKDIDAL